MANPNPKTAHLAGVRGRRPKTGRTDVLVRLSEEEQGQLKELAEHYQLLYGGQGSISALLSKIAGGELMVVPTPPPLVLKLLLEAQQQSGSKEVGSSSQQRAASLIELSQRTD